MSEQQPWPQPSRIPAEAELAFDRLYRSSRDDVYAYAAGLLRDRAAAEEVTATAFERAYRKRSRFDPSRGSLAPGSSASPATPPSTSCAAAAARPSSARTRSTPRAAGQGDQRSELRLLLDGALAKLEARERELIALKFFAGLSNAEIAA